MWINKRKYNYLIFRLDEIEKDQTRIQLMLAEVLAEKKAVKRFIDGDSG